jgi:hypothetical protein
MPRDQWGALEADLVRSGFVLDDYPARLDLRAITALYVHAVPGSSVYRLNTGVKGEWRWNEELLALALEALWDSNWQRAGNRTAPRPKRLPRPGQEPENARHFGDRGMTIAEFEAFWNSN